MPSRIRIVGRSLWGVAVTTIALVVACSSPTASSSGGTCPAPAAGKESCGSCGSHCYYCATGTCPADPCTTTTCDGTAHCSTKSPDAAHPTWSYCGSCTTTGQCFYCAPGTCPANACSDKCDSTGGYGPVGRGGGGGGAAGSCPATSQLQCSQWTTCKNCNIQSCTCYDNNGTTPFCGIYYHTSDGAMFWCGSGSSCSTFNCVAQAQNATAHCCQ